MPSTGAKLSVCTAQVHSTSAQHTPANPTRERMRQGDQEIKIDFGYKLRVCGTMSGGFGAGAQPKNSCRVGKYPVN